MIICEFEIDPILDGSSLQTICFTENPIQSIETIRVFETPVSDTLTTESLIGVIFLAGLNAHGCELLKCT